MEEEVTRSGESVGTAVKRRKSPRCLIVKKKNAGSSGTREGVSNFTREKKRAPMIVISDDDSSSSEEPPLESKVRKVGLSRTTRSDGNEKSDGGGRGSGKRKRSDCYMNNRNVKEKLDAASEEPIRVKGRNGVFKVVVNNEKKGGSVFLRSKAATVEKKELARRSSFYSEQNVRQKAAGGEKSKLCPTKNSTEKQTFRSEKVSQKKKKRGGDKPVKLVRGNGEITPLSENVPAGDSNEGKVKGGSLTEKQKLREQIKKMLLDAGWKIDYRPRKFKDYQDAVYIDPSGSGYWSITRAYDALQKQFDEEGDMKPSGECSFFTPISTNILKKLTRQTKKKTEKEMRQKQGEAFGSKKKRTAICKSDTMSKVSDKKGRAAKSALIDSDIEILSETSNSSDDDCNRNLGKGKKTGRCTLVARGTGTVENSQADGYVLYTGKRTLLSWLIDSGTVGPSEKVKYMNRRQTKVMQEGWITRDGIHCGCCSKILSVAKFEIHAGSKLRQPFQNIYLESGISLLQCQMDAWNKQEESERSSFHSVCVEGGDPNDDTCGICGDGGDLICCDGCPSTFHQSCLGMKILPTGDWHCSNCACKFCGMAGISGTDDANDMTDCDLPTCSLCERKYHQSCILDLDALPDESTSPFCGKMCREMFENLQKLIGVKHELEEGFSWSLVHRTDTSNSDTSATGFAHEVECNSKVAVALTVMDECFMPIVDIRSGINIVHNVLYNCGSNFNRLNFCGFYTAILERGDEIISAASIRFHGPQLAEMPFIGTRHIYRRQGMCNRLYRAIESALCSLTVERLILPAISELRHTWTEVFGFNYLNESQKEKLRSINMLVFLGTATLEKLLKDQNHLRVTDCKGGKSTIPGSKSAEDSLVQDTEVGTDDNTGDSVSVSLSSEVTLTDISKPTTCLDDLHEVKVSPLNDEFISSNEDNVPEPGIESKSIFPPNESKEILDSSFECNIKPSEDISNCKGNTEVLVKEDISTPEFFVDCDIKVSEDVTISEDATKNRMKEANSIESSLVDGDSMQCKKNTEVLVTEDDSIMDPMVEDDIEASEDAVNCKETTEVLVREDSLMQNLVDDDDKHCEDSSNCREKTELLLREDTHIGDSQLEVEMDPSEDISNMPENTEILARESNSVPNPLVDGDIMGDSQVEVEIDLSGDISNIPENTEILARESNSVLDPLVDGNIMRDSQAEVEVVLSGDISIIPENTEILVRESNSVPDPLVDDIMRDSQVEVEIDPSDDISNMPESTEILARECNSVPDPLVGDYKLSQDVSNCIEDTEVLVREDNSIPDSLVDGDIMQNAEVIERDHHSKRDSFVDDHTKPSDDDGENTESPVIESNSIPEILVRESTEALVREGDSMSNTLVDDEIKQSENLPNCMPSTDADALLDVPNNKENNEEDSSMQNPLVHDKIKPSEDSSMQDSHVDGEIKPSKEVLVESDLHTSKEAPANNSSDIYEETKGTSVPTSLTV